MNGRNTHPLFNSQNRSARPPRLNEHQVELTKFLVDRNGTVVRPLQQHHDTKADPERHRAPAVAHAGGPQRASSRRRCPDCRAGALRRRLDGPSDVYRPDAPAGGSWRHMPLGVLDSYRYWGDESVFVRSLKGGGFTSTDGRCFVDYRLGYGPIIPTATRSTRRSSMPSRTSAPYVGFPHPWMPRWCGASRRCAPTSKRCASQTQVPRP